MGVPATAGQQLASTIAHGRNEEAFRSINGYRSIEHDKSQLDAHFWYLASLAARLEHRWTERDRYEGYMRTSEGWSKLDEGDFRRAAALSLMRLCNYVVADEELEKARLLHAKDSNRRGALLMARGMMAFLRGINHRAYGFHQEAEHTFAESKLPDMTWRQENLFYLYRAAVALHPHGNSTKKRFTNLIQDSQMDSKLRLRAKALNRFGRVAVHLDRLLEQRLYQ